jgi:uncharacterized protein
MLDPQIVSEQSARDFEEVSAEFDDCNRWRWLCACSNPAVCIVWTALHPTTHDRQPCNRSFLKQDGAPNIPIQAIGLSLYESLSSDGANAVEEPGTKVTRTQWLDLSSLHMDSLIGKNILIVDEVDDTRTTLEYAVRELEKDVETARKKSGRTGTTKFYIFVLHNKLKPKKGRLPEDMEQGKTYISAMETEDVWICYPWEAKDIDEHDENAEKYGLKAISSPGEMNGLAPETKTTNGNQ